MKVKIFDIKDEKKINDFMNSCILAGESPIKFDTEHFLVFYEEEEMFDKFSKLKLLHKNLKEIGIRILESQKEIKFTEGEIEFEKKEIDKIDKKESSKKFDMMQLLKEQEGIIDSKKKLIELETGHANGIRKLIKEVEKE